MEKADLLISAKIVLSLETDAILTEAGVVIKGDNIISIDKLSHLLKSFLPKKHLHYKHGLIMPGLINGHTHIPMTLFRGLADDVPLMEWLTHYIFPLEQHLKPQWVYWGALLGCAELIMSGTTCFCDMYPFGDEVAKAADRAGLRAIVGEALYDFPSPNYGSIEKGFIYVQNLIKKWSNHPRISIAIVPHAIYTCSPNVLISAKKISEKYATLYTIHLSETKSEVEETRKKYNLTPIEYMAKLNILDNAVIAKHCVWLEENDINLLKKHQVKVIHNPESNLKLGAGIAPIPRLLSEGITVGLGTDGPASNNDLDMFLEMDTTAKIHKLKEANPTVMPAREVLSMAIIGGARALGMEKQIGTLSPGKKADLIVIDLNKPHLMPLYNPISQLIYAANGQDVLTTVVNGKILMEDRRLLTLDLDEIYSHINNIKKEIQTILPTNLALQKFKYIL
jgi:5-methylthioadenosine/S-adenosylhomocysteine deaminase